MIFLLRPLFLPLDKIYSKCSICRKCPEDGRLCAALFFQPQFFPDIGAHILGVHLKGKGKLLFNDRFHFFQCLGVRCGEPFGVFPGLCIQTAAQQ